MSSFWRYRCIKLLSVLLMFTFSVIFATNVEAASWKGSRTNTAPVITLGDTGTISVNENTNGAIGLTANDSTKDTLSWSIGPVQPSNGFANVGVPTVGRGTSTFIVT